MLRFFCTENILTKKIGLVLNEPQMRLLLKNPGGTFLRVQTDISIHIFYYLYIYKYLRLIVHLKYNFILILLDSYQPLHSCKE